MRGSHAGEAWGLAPLGQAKRIKCPPKVVPDTFSVRVFEENFVTVCRQCAVHLSSVQQHWLTDHKRRNVMGIDGRTSGSDASKQKGGIGYVLMWFLGVPIPILIIIALLRGCA